MNDFKTAVIQIKPFRDIEKSLERVLAMTEEAAGAGAVLVTLPEIFYHPYELPGLPALACHAERMLEAVRAAAVRHKIWLCAGSIAFPDGDSLKNRAHLISPEGKIVLTHDKTHLFDVTFKELCARESAVFAPGDSFSTACTPLGRIGILVCFDIRFPEAARKLALAGAEIILVPAAFNTITGPAHWDILFRCRAIENQVHVIAASPARDNAAVYNAYGHSLVADPWGTVLAEAGAHEEIIYADIKAEKLREIRKSLPLLSLRRPEIY
jgi:predicted amidohydrolase